jgi:hypothetical protein
MEMIVHFLLRLFYALKSTLFSTIKFRAAATADLDAVTVLALCILENIESDVSLVIII